MPVERRERVIAICLGSTGNGRNPMFNGRRQPSCGGTSRMNREVQVRFCERLGVKFPGPTRRQGLFKGLCVVLGILGISWLALEYFIPSPPSKITIATGSKGTSLEYFGQHYREKLERLGINVELHETAGSVEDFKLLNDPKSGVDVSFVTRGLTDNSQASALLSLGVINQ